MIDIELQVAGNTYTGTVQNLSKYGTIVSTDAHLSKGTAVKLGFHTQSGWLVVEGRMVGPVHSGIVIQFATPVKDARLTRFVAEYARAAGALEQKHTRKIIPPVLTSLIRECGRADDGRVLVAGDLADIGIETLLTTLERTRKTGRLHLTQGSASSSATIDFIGGAVAASSTGGDRSTVDRCSVVATVFEVLQWTSGTFELRASLAEHAEAPGSFTISELLLECARLRDEVSRAKS